MTSVLTSLILAQIRSDIKNDLEVVFTHGAVGTDATTPTAGDTTLGTEVFRDAIDEFDKSAADKIVASLRILTTEANGNTVREFGWFNAAAAGSMWNHSTPNEIAKTSDINLYIDTTITIVVTEG